ncbi:sodium-coupled neutral amino acid transporter 5 isoform X1 [Dromiciops gliroides]|uniref:sodium-coupled neutral amino acid transporter 5 isoform X1 n=1 Tax=Dromiciops gliroides TaxID=33562 RepID=UPI001CC4D63E|nr:sodium-coupled neutral amino acid transporter 5 isoform X1 [Dromiciops gliroides]XP_043829680.1 sodium-coupled neutral amino acid transporter 5 isoform X1 [Dromiciops gliroides]
MELTMREPRMNGLVPRGHPESEQSQAELAGFLPQPPPGKKAVQFSDFEGKTSLGMSMFNLSNAIMGSGILGLAYAMANTGILLFLALLLCMALLSAYSIHLLLTCAGFVGIRAYEELGRRAFGTYGKVAAAGVICLHNIGAMSSYLYIIKSELPLVIGTFLDSKATDSSWFLDGNVLIILVSIGIILPLALMRHLGYLGYTSGLSLTCMVFFLASVIYKKFSIQCPLTVGNSSLGPAKGLNDTCEVQFFTINSQTAYTIPILAFAFVCHPEVLPIYTELRRPSQRRMQAVANMSIGAMFLMYGLTATFGYLTFFGSVEAEMLHMYSQTDLLILCVRLAVLMAVTLTVPVVLFPIRRAIQQLLFPTKAFSWARHITIALGLLTLVNVLVIFVPNIRDIFGVIGATSAPSLIFILPSIFYIRIIPRDQESLASRPKIQAATFATLGIVIMAMSLGFIFTDWAVTGQSKGAGH